MSRAGSLTSGFGHERWPERFGYRFGFTKWIDAMAVIYLAATLIWLLIALRFVNPMQIVARARQPTN